MNDSSLSTRTGNEPNLAAGIAMRFGVIVVMLVIQAALLFGGAGRLDWLWAWVYLGISLVVVLINGTILLRTCPEMVAERGRPKEMKGWDKVVSGVGGIAMYLVLPLVAGLDARQFFQHRSYSTKRGGLWPPLTATLWVIISKRSRVSR